MNSEFEIMSWDEYAKSEHDTPYIFRLNKGNKELIYFGSPHTNKIKDPIFSNIRELFDSTNPDCVFVEGMSQLEEIKADPTKYTTSIESVKNMLDDEIVLKYAEPGFGIKLAVEKGIDFYSPEPKFKDEIAHLLNSGITQEEIFVEYVYRQLYQYYRNNEASSVEEYLQGIITELAQATHWDNFEYTVENAESIGRDIWGDRADIHTSKYIVERTDPTPRENDFQTRITLAAQASSNFRDQYIVKKIQEGLERYDRLFVVFGASHAYMQRPALEKLFMDM